ncbi:MAG: ABC transporter ATP-binding protein [Micrococcales bacterium]|nr:ABC transporter ATP-binding protein [Micrococcales bacterium]
MDEPQTTTLDLEEPGAPDAPGITARDVRRSFGSVRAVDGMSFTVPAGSVTALVGPNGSGKTTLLLILAGLLQPDTGEVTVAGLDVLHDNEGVRRTVGWMPDIFGTWDSLTCRQILTTFGRAHWMSPGAARERAAELLDQMHLAEFADRPARVLSRGQKQRLGLARVLVHDPQVLLLDEPASGMDPRSRVELRDTLRSLAEAGKTVLVSSHILSDLEEVYNHAVFVSQGRTVDAEVQPETAERGWRLEAADPVALRVFLERVDIPYTQNSGSPEVLVQLSSWDSAVQLVRAAVKADVPLHTIAPVAGRLEETYLALNEERV